MKKNYYIYLLLLFFITSCFPEPDTPFKVEEEEKPIVEEPPIPNGWLVPPSQVRAGGPGKDGIRSIEAPRFMEADGITYLKPDDLVTGIKIGDDARAYPHRILNWHELINDVVADFPVTVTYHPFTGTSVAWSRVIDNQPTTFGSSGLLYKNNLVPYDRKTESLWSQMRMDCVNGDKLGTQLQTFRVIETTWATWRKMFPMARIMTTETGYNRDYNYYPYGDFRTDHERFFIKPVRTDDRLPSKERVLGVPVGERLIVYRFLYFRAEAGEPVVINDTFNNMGLVVAGNSAQNYLVAYGRKLADGTTLNFHAVKNQEPAILEDQEGNRWNIFGEAIGGGRTGQQLPSLQAHIGFWYTWVDFYKDIRVY